VPEDDPQRENVVKINKLAHSCRIIVQGLLDFARQQTAQPRPVQINRILRDVIGFLDGHLLLKNVAVQTNLDPDLPMVSGEENKLEQVFVNLIINAAQSMEGKGVMTFRTEFAPDTDRVRVRCSDTGCGIAEENLDSVFEPFFTTKEKGKGTGLGLSICHGIIEQHGGTITVESSEGKGSTFTIFLPVADGDPALLADNIVNL
jgi:signal transduction histidine kinase